MKLYQPTVQQYKYSFWKGRWVEDLLHASTLIFVDFEKAHQYKHDFVEGLKRRGYKITEKNSHAFVAELYIDTDTLKKELRVKELTPKI